MERNTVMNTYKKIFSVFGIIVCMLAFVNSLRHWSPNSIFSKLSSLKRLESAMTQSFPGKKYFREFYGACNLLLSPHEFGFDKNTIIVKDKDGFMEPFHMTAYNISEAEEKLIELSTVCKEAGAQFVYISFPGKSDSRTIFSSYGIDTNSEEVRKDFLQRLSSHNIHLLNVRQQLEADGYNKKDYFYKADHHWTVPAGLYSARLIANFLNDSFGYSLRSNLLDTSLFTFKVHKNIWLGETGRKTSLTWAGTLDDFTEVFPNYNTHLQTGTHFGNYDKKGSFSMFIDKRGYNGKTDKYKYSAHYSYRKNIDSPTWIHNDDVEGKKILLIIDSFSVAVIPFLSLTPSDIAVWDIRKPKTKNGLYQFIRDNHFDVVLVEYTDFWSKKMYNFN